MKALCIKQPYASDIMAGRKTVEWRSWRTHYRGELIITSAKKPAERLDNKKDYPLGYALGTVELVDVKYFPDEDCYGWIFENPKPFKKPVPVKSQLGIFNLEIQL